VTCQIVGQLYVGVRIKLWLQSPDDLQTAKYLFQFHVDTVARMRRLYKTGIGLTTGFIGSHTVTHNYSVYTLQLTTTESLLVL
jgi:hypothetical protein